MNVSRRECGGTIVESALVLTLVMLIASPALIPIGNWVGYRLCDLQQANRDRGLATYDDRVLDTHREWSHDLRDCVDSTFELEDDDDFPPPFDYCQSFPWFCSG